MKQIIGIMAATAEGVIGKNGLLPWHYPNELEYLRKTTLNHIIIMGRKTYDSIPKQLLIKRRAIVLSKNTGLKLRDALVCNSLSKCMQYLNNTKSCKIFMIGGGEIATLFLKNDLISSFLLTKILHPFDGDTYLQLEYFNKWNKIVLQSTTDYKY